MSTALRNGLIIGGVISIGISRALERAAEAREQARRQEAIDDFIKEINENYPRELALRIVSHFKRENFSSSFNASPIIDQFFDAKLFQFCLPISEAFADSVIVRKKKFLGYEMSLSVKELFERSLTGSDIGRYSAEALADDWVAFLKKSDDEFRGSRGELTVDQALDKKIQMSNVFTVTDGYSIIIYDDYRCVELPRAQPARAFRDLNERHKSYPNDKIWREISDKAQKSKIIEENINHIRAALAKPG